MIRWNIQDQVTGEVVIVVGPTTHQARENLRAIIKHITNIGQRRAFA